MLLEVQFIIKSPDSLIGGRFFKSMLIHNKNLITISQGQVGANSGKTLHLNYVKDDRVSLLIINDIFLDQYELAKSLEIHLRVQNHHIIVNPLKRIEWVGRGMFLLDIGAPVKELYRKSSTVFFPSAINT